MNQTQHWSKMNEEAVLGAILLDNKVLPKVVSFLEPDHFYQDSSRLIYTHILDLHKYGIQIDVVTLHESLKKAGQVEKAGGMYQVTGLPETCPSPSNAPTYAKAIYKHYLQRRLLKLGYQLYKGTPEQKAEAYAQIKNFDLIPTWEQSDSIELHSFENIIHDTTPQPPQLIDHGLLPAQSILLLSGAPKTGKSILSLNLGLCLSSGQNWFQFKVETPVKVLFLQSEVVKWALKNRLEKMKQGCEFSIPENSFFISEPFQCDIRSDEGYKMVCDAISTIDPGVVIFDPLIAYHVEDENSNDHMERVMAKFRELTFLGLSVILIHHSRKLSDSYTILNPRGASSITGAVDSVMELSKDNEGHIISKFDLRYDQAPEEMTFRRNPDTLWLERYNPELEAQQNNTIIRILADTGKEGKPLAEIAKRLSNEFEKSDRTTRRWISSLAKIGIITIIGGGPNKRVVLTCNLD